MSTTRTLSERDETYVGDIVRDENWLKSAPATPRTDSSIVFAVRNDVQSPFVPLSFARTLETELAAAKEAHASQQRVAIQAMSELAAATKRIADCEFLLAHRYKIIERQEPRCKEAIARAEKAEAEVERLKDNAFHAAMKP